ncbi:DODA-type extradiol aromatic ring-opening family dioxygenase [Noviherbaspirillum sp.]|uniref:DODA-type extradiol aromatic ring-opening family dioxygenase n=1 Tax=Noviherbaspirillum sp. TaxID=1926288 RepID=UPI002FE299FA
MHTSGYPGIFVSHGAPTLLLEDVPARHFLAGYGQHLGKPRAIIVISAHDLASTSVVSTAPRHHAVHDFRGFPQALYEMDYTPPGDAPLAQKVAVLLRSAGLAVEEAENPGLDHGAWVPLKLMYPEADVPVVSVSLDMSLPNARLIEIGRALGGLRADGVLIMASGSFTHNLREFRPGQLHAEPPAYAVEFAAWMSRVLLARDDQALIDWERNAPHALRAHPTTEHFLPLLVAYGAGNERTELLHKSFTHGVIGMHAFAFA